MLVGVNHRMEKKNYCLCHCWSDSPRLSSTTVENSWQERGPELCGETEETTRTLLSLSFYDGLSSHEITATTEHHVLCLPRTKKEGRKELRTEFLFNTSTLTKTITPEFEPQQTQDSGLLSLSQYLLQKNRKKIQTKKYLSCSIHRNEIKKNWKRKIERNKKAEKTKNTTTTNRQTKISSERAKR